MKYKALQEVTIACMLLAEDSLASVSFMVD